MHGGRAFDDVALADFVKSALAIAPVLALRPANASGRRSWMPLLPLRRVVRSNTNLGIVLLLAPLAAVPTSQTLAAGIGPVLADLDLGDSRNVFAAIRLAEPGGLGRVSDQDVAGVPTLPLGQVMALAADRDLIARQYVNGFQEVLHFGVPVLLEGRRRFADLETAIRHTQLEFLAEFPDSLIARKRGLAEALTAGRMAAHVLAAGWPGAAAGARAWQALDQWLRQEGNGRNPGTTADLIAASLFAALRDGELPDTLTLPETPPSPVRG